MSNLPSDEYCLVTVFKYKDVLQHNAGICYKCVDFVNQISVLDVFCISRRKFSVDCDLKQ